MNRRRKMIFIAVMLLLVCGLVLVGPVHHALHGHHGLHDDARLDNGGDYCDGCTISSLESPTAFTVSGIVICARERLDSPVVRAPNAQPPLFHSPRGPPARA
jgi:hypothetical protein